MLADRVLRGLGLGDDAEQRDTTFANPDAWLVDALGGSKTYSDRRVNPKSALTLIPVFAAVRIIAESVGSLPLHVFRRLERGRERATDTHLYRLLAGAPNDEMAPGHFYETITAHLNLWGNAYVEKEYERIGQDRRVSALWPLVPSRVQVERDKRTGEKRFRVDGAESTLGQATILHVPAMGYDGLLGLSPIQQCRQNLGIVDARVEYEGRFYANNATPGGYIKHPSTLRNPEAVERLKVGWEAKHGSLANAHRPAVLEEGAEWVATGVPLRDQQFLELAQFDTTQVANLFRVPPSMIGGGTGDSLTYGNRESDALNFVTYSLLRWLTRITEALQRDPDLFPPQSRTFYPDFVIEKFLQGDAQSRAQFYRTMYDMGAITTQEIRDRENLPPLEDDELPEPSSNGNGNGAKVDLEQLTGSKA